MFGCFRCARLLGIGGEIAKIVHLCIDRNRRESPNHDHTPLMSPLLHSCGSPQLTHRCIQRLLLCWAGKISSVSSPFELFSPCHGTLGECNLVFLAANTRISERHIM